MWQEDIISLRECYFLQNKERAILFLTLLIYNKSQPFGNYTVKIPQIYNINIIFFGNNWTSGREKEGRGSQNGNSWHLHRKEITAMPQFHVYEL